MFFQRAVADGKKNLWGTPLSLLELESEHSAMSTCEGAALAGGRVTNFTSAQGLLLMKEVLYVISGKRLPMILHIGARTLTSQALCIHAGHDDVMGCADVGWGILFCKNNQYILDLSIIARRASEDSETPFMVVQDGFLATHTSESCFLPEPELMKQFVGDPRKKIRNLFDPRRGLMIGVVENQDAFMKGKFAQRYFYDHVPRLLQNAMEEYYHLTGRRYNMTDGFMLEDAEYVIAGMGTMIETAEAVIEELRREGLKVGVMHITSFRPFPSAEIVQKLSKVKAITVVERCDIPLAQSNPLTIEIKAAFSDALTGAPGMPQIERIPVIYTCVAGIGSRDVKPDDFIAMVDNMRKGERKRLSAVGIIHPEALPRTRTIDLRAGRTYCLRGHSIGGLGSVTTVKALASMLNDAFNLNVQAYPKFSAEKRGLPTTYFLGASDSHVKFHYEYKDVNFVDVVDPNAFKAGNPLAGLEEGGILLIHTEKTPEEVWRELPSRAKRTIVERKIKSYVLETIKLIREVTTDPEFTTRLRGIALLGAFLRLSPIKQRFGYSDEQIFSSVENVLRKTFGEKGEHVVQTNLELVKKCYYGVKELPVVGE
jgi:pyruvate-ferredoxin/flavodoxin oxidoreductase